MPNKYFTFSIKSTTAFVAAGLLLLAACNPTKHVPAGDALYTGATFKLKNISAPKKYNSGLKEDLAGLIRPKPNGKIIGIRFKLGIYNMAGKKDNFINRFLRKTGEPPVLLSSVNVDRNIKVLANTLENKGFFHATVIGDTTIKGKFASAKYEADAGVQYKINNVTFPDDSSSKIGRAHV